MHVLQEPFRGFRKSVEEDVDGIVDLVIELICDRDVKETVE